METIRNMEKIRNMEITNGLDAYNVRRGTKRGIRMDDNWVGDDVFVEDVDTLLSCIHTWQNDRIKHHLHSSSASEKTDRSEKQMEFDSKNKNSAKAGNVADYLNLKASGFSPASSPKIHSKRSFTSENEIDKKMVLNVLNHSIHFERIMDHDCCGSQECGEIYTTSADFNNEAQVGVDLKTLAFLNGNDNFQGGSAPSSRSSQLYNMGVAEFDQLSCFGNFAHFGSIETNNEERLSESEVNPLLPISNEFGHGEKPETDKVSLITEDDLLIKNTNICLRNDEMYTKGSTLLKDVTLNCQIDQIKANQAPQQKKACPRKIKETTKLDEDKIRLVDSMERVRGVCFCASDNSWTAWWTEKGRNRKKAFKLSLYGFDEARRLAIEHRRQIEELLPELLEKRPNRRYSTPKAQQANGSTGAACQAEKSLIANKELDGDILPGSRLDGIVTRSRRSISSAASVGNGIDASTRAASHEFSNHSGSANGYNHESNGLKVDCDFNDQNMKANNSDSNNSLNSLQNNGRSSQLDPALLSAIERALMDCPSNGNDAPKFESGHGIVQVLPQVSRGPGEPAVTVIVINKT